MTRLSLRQWHYAPKLGLSIGAAPKCGSASIRDALSGCEVQTQVVGAGRRIWVVRHPVDRFISLWKNKCRDGHKLQYRGNRYFVKDWTLEALLSFIESNPQPPNHNWAQQHQLEGGHDSTLIALEHLNEWWEEQGFGIMPVSNPSAGDVEISDAIRGRIIKHYVCDMNLYAEAIDDY